MNVLHYSSLSCYNDPVLVTERRLKTILLAKEEHQKLDGRHIFQC